MTVLFCIDLDGTIADVRDRYAKAGAEPDRTIDTVAYNEWLLRVQSKELILADKPLPGMRALLWALSRSPAQCIYVTARGEEFRNVTEDWLIKNGFPAFELIMRPTDNLLPSAQFKEKMIRLARWRYRAMEIVVLDDLPEVTEMALANGWTPLQAFGGY